MASNNTGGNWDKRRRKILFYAGLGGVFIYLGITEFLGAQFHLEFLLIFAAMMGISIAQGVDK